MRYINLKPGNGEMPLENIYLSKTKSFIIDSENNCNNLFQGVSTNPSVSIKELEEVLLKRSVLLLCVDIKRNIRKSLKAQPQMGWDLLGTHHLAESIESVGKNVARATEDAKGISANVNETISRAIDLLLPELTKVNNTGAMVAGNTEGIGNCFTEIGELISWFTSVLKSTPTLLMVLGMLYITIELAERKFDIPNIKYIKILIASFAIFKVGLQAKELFVTWLVPKDVVAGVIAQADWSDWMQVSIQAVIFLIFGATLDFGTLTKAIKSLGDAASHISKLQDLFVVITTWFKSVMTLICEKFGIEVFEWLKPQDTLIKDFMHRVNVLTQRYVENPMNVDAEYAANVTRLLLEINDYMKSVPINSKNQPVTMAIKTLQDRVAQLQRHVNDAGLEIGERDEPAFIPIAGAPGIGKTYFADFLAQDLAISSAKDPVEVMDMQRNWKRAVYSWPLDNKHHDMYRGQRIVMYPDLFCQTDAEGQQSEATSLVYLVGGQAVQLPAAEMSKKQKLWFVSDIVIACTNVVYIHDRMFKSLRKDRKSVV